MKMFGLLAVLMALAGPAWAANDDRPEIKVANSAATEVCIQSGTPSSICVMKYAIVEADALDVAQRSLKTCSEKTVSNPDECPVIRAYIRQRWGY